MADSAVLYRRATGLTRAGVLARPAPAEEMMRLLVNGEERRFADVDHIAALVAALGLDSRKVAVERNLEIVPRSAYAATGLSDGDRIEIVHFIGGG
jgi:thiamine biosynthesis protein ThiS